MGDQSHSPYLGSTPTILTPTALMLEVAPALISYFFIAIK
jgi:hypothetical protein